MRRTLPVLGVALCGLTVLAEAQAPPAAAPAPPTREALQQRVSVLTARAKAQQANVDKLTAQLQAANKEFEGQLARLTQYVSDLKDTPDSGTRSLRLKQEVLDGLKKLVEFYGRERGQRLAALRNAATRIPKEDLRADVAALDAMIDKQVEQIVALARSFPPAKDVPKYAYHWNDDADDLSRRTNPEYMRQQRLGSTTEMSQADLAKALQQSVDRLRQQNLQLERAAQNARSAEERDFCNARIGENKQRIEKRLYQVETLRANPREGNRLISTKEYLTLQERFLEFRKELRAELQTMLKLRNDRDVERERLKITRLDLAQAERALAAMPK